MIKDLSGKKFGKLQVIRYAGSDHKGDAYWECKCEYDVTKIIKGGELRIGDYKSCGCGKKLHPVKHNLSRSSEYQAAAHAKERCEKSHHKSYRRYGGRGITFRFSSVGECTDYMVRTFGRKPVGMTLDRIDNNGHYEPGNLRWATRKQQQQNRSQGKCQKQLNQKTMTNYSQQ